MLSFKRGAMSLSPQALSWTHEIALLTRNGHPLGRRMPFKITSLVGQHDGARFEPVKQVVRGRGIERLASRKPEPNRQALAIDERVDLGRKTAPQATETMISTSFSAVAARWCARLEVLSIIWMSPS